MTLKEIRTAIVARKKMNWTRREIISMRDKIFEERCPGKLMGEDDAALYADAAILALNHLVPFKLLDPHAAMRRGIG